MRKFFTSRHLPDNNKSTNTCRELLNIIFIVYIQISLYLKIVDFLPLVL